MMRTTLLQATKAFALLVAFYLALGLVAYMMPEGAVGRHVRQSLNSGDLAEDYPQAILWGRHDSQDQYTMDNFTDALILNQALMMRSEGLRGILLMPRFDRGVNQCLNLQTLVYGGAEGNTIHYARYWHGSTFLARIMLVFVSYTGIRYLLFVLTTALLMWCVVSLGRKAGWGVAVAIAAGLLSVNVFVMQFSLQFAQVLMVALGGMIWLAGNESAVRRPEVTFFVLGSVTVFLDLLTVPTMTLGLPLLVLIALRKEERPWRGIGMMASVTLWWGVAYVLTWLAKWGLATLLTGENIFSDAYGQGALWQEGGSSYIAEAVSSCLGFLHWKPIVVGLVLLAVLTVIRPQREAWPQALQYALVALLPFAYYLAMAHPVQHHAWFNYRALATAVAALLLALGSMVDWKRIKLFRHE